MTKTNWLRYTTVVCDVRAIRTDSGARIEVEAYSRRTGETLARREWDSPLERDLPRIDPHTQRQIALRMATELIQEAEAKALVEAAEIERRGGQ